MIHNAVAEVRESPDTSPRTDSELDQSALKPAGYVHVQSRPARICIVTSIHPDFDARVFRHARSVAEAGYNVDLICPWELAAGAIPHNLRLIRFQRVQRRLLRPALIPRRVLPFLLAKQYDLFHFHDLDLLPLMAGLKLWTRKPVIYDCHENYPQEMLSRAYRIPNWSRHLLASAVKWVERLAAGIIREVVTVVPQQSITFPAPWFHTTLVQNFAEIGLEAGRAPDLATRPDACISTASQYLSNGALFVVEVAREVVRRRPHVKFYVVDRFGSDRDLRERLLALIASVGLQQSFHLLPNVSPQNIMLNLNRATIGLSPNLDTPKQVGALPIKLVEYMAAGLPIVAADLPNIRALLTKTGAGLLAQPGDATSFADSICNLVDNKALAQSLGQSGLRAFRGRFNWEHEVSKVLNLYNRLLDER